MAARMRGGAWLASAGLHVAGAALMLGRAPGLPPESAAAPVVIELAEPAPAEEVPAAEMPWEATLATDEPTRAEASEPQPVSVETPEPPHPEMAETLEAAPIKETAEAPEPPPPPRMPPPPHPVRRAAAARPVSPADTPAPATRPAPAPAAAAPRAAPQAVMAAPSPSYIARLLAALERQKHYPEEARTRHAQGVALLRFRMRRDGSVVVWRIERSAGDAALDEAVVAMIRRASPLPAPPPELAGETLELTVPVRFALR